MLAAPTLESWAGAEPRGPEQDLGRGGQKWLRPLLTPSLGSPSTAPRTQEDKAWLSLGEGWEEETLRPKLPRPHSSANESSLKAG